MLDNFIENNIFSGKDQNILNNIYIKYRNNLIELIIPEKNIIDKWFYMLYYISIKIYFFFSNKNIIFFFK